MTIPGLGGHRIKSASTHCNQRIHFGLSGLRIFLALPLAMLLGCGVNPSSAPPTTYLNLTGNWVAVAPPVQTTPLTMPSPVAEFLGALQSSDGIVTGTFRVLGPFLLPNGPCILINQDLPASGTLSPTGNLSLQVPIAGGAATITAALSQDLHSIALNGSWQIIGGPCAMPLTSIAMTEHAPLTGTYIGTLNLLDLRTGTTSRDPATATMVTAVLTQSNTPDAGGRFPINGAITSTGACPATLTLANILVTGPNLHTENPGTPPVPPFDFNGYFDPNAASIVATMNPFPTCNFKVYQGTLNRQ